MRDQLTRASTGYIDFLEKLPQDRQAPGPTQCEQKGCQGYLWQWYGSLKLDVLDAGWKQISCDCDEGLRKEVQENLNNLREKNLIRFKESVMKKHKCLTLESFDITNNASCQWYTKVKEWFENWKPSQTQTNTENPTNLTLMGGVGVGKTGLLIAGTTLLIEKFGVSAEFITVETFADKVWGKGGTQLLTQMKTVNILIVDDLGAGHPDIQDSKEKSPLGKLYGVLNERWGNGLTTLTSSNCTSKKAFQRAIGTRNFSRLQDNCSFALCLGKDLRITEKSTWL